MKTKAVREGDRVGAQRSQDLGVERAKGRLHHPDGGDRSGLGARGGITAFIIDRDTPGFTIEREIPMIGGARTYELVLDDVRLGDSQVLGEVGQGFAPMQKRLTVRRLEMGAMCVGTATRALEMMCEHVQQRESLWPEADPTGRPSNGGSPTRRQRSTPPA